MLITFLITNYEGCDRHDTFILSPFLHVFLASFLSGIPSRLQYIEKEREKERERAMDKDVQDRGTSDNLSVPKDFLNIG